MVCPYCGKEMEAGFIQCRNGVTWTPKLQFLASLSFLGKGAIRLENGVKDSLTAVHAHNCPECRKVIIEYTGE